MTRSVSVLKLGGSVLTGPRAYRQVAAFIADRIDNRPDERIVAVVSAELGTTDALLETAREIVEEPDPSSLDLLWSTGELRSAALLALSLQSAGVNAIAINVQQTGIWQPADSRDRGASRIRPLRLRALLATYDVVVAPGFLARGDGDSVVSLGRGGSDLTAVILAAGLGATRCELIKDVPGYFTADPKEDPAARPIAALPYSRAIEMADNGCELVQRAALETARTYRVALQISAIGANGTTHISHTQIPLSGAD
jgi:aspartate kinase